MGNANSSTAPDDATADPLDGLSAQQRRVAELAARGLGNRAIARELWIEVPTVKHHLCRVFDRLRLTSRSELAALVAGHLPPEPKIVRRVRADMPTLCHPDFDVRLLQARVEDLQRANRDAAVRWRPTVPPTRGTLAVAVRRVGTAEGRSQTTERLRQLAAEALAWADVLSQSERRADRAA
jgi:DNA-binding CsgD family transcriptional regulator